MNLSGMTPKLTHYDRPPKDAHFAASEQPKLFLEEVRAGFRSLRQKIIKKEMRDD